jgi:deoxyribose-phosphate aldolase
LSVPQTLRAARIAQDAGADFLKTSTGFGLRGATVEDVRRLGAAASLPVKAAGGIRTLAGARALLEAGAARLGSSSSVAILAEL